jgi:putative CocE/NonD family hydrolase
VTSVVVSGVVEERVAVPMRDGVRLHTIVTRPASGRSPVLLLRSPYSAEAGDAAVVQTFVHGGGSHTLAAEGWAVVHQDCRGRFASEGEDRPFAHDVSDGYDTIEWAAAQPWSTGRVVTSAPSGLGAMQHLAALSRHPALVAINPQVGVPDPRTGWIREGGALQLRFILAWAAQQGLCDPRLSDEDRAVNTAVYAAPDEHVWDVLSASPLLDHSRFFRAWLSGDRAYWREVEEANRGPVPEVAAFHMSGWHDIFAEASLAAYERMQALGARPQRLVVGPWSHTTLYQSKVGEVDHGPDADGGGLRAEMLAWLRQAAEGGPDADLDSGARLFVTGRNQWVDLPSWPPPSRPGPLFLAAGGRLSPAPDESSGQTGFRYDPADPVPTRGGRALFVPDGPWEQSPVEQREDVVVFTGPPLGQDTTVMGLVEAEVFFATTGRSADVTVKLCDVHPDGRSFNVVDSVRRHEFEPGRVERVPVSVGRVAHTFLAGHRIRVQVSSSNFPRLDRNPSNTADVLAAERLDKTDQSVCFGGRTPSRLVLPVH